MRLLLPSALALLTLAVPVQAQNNAALAAQPIAFPLSEDAVDAPARITPRLVSALESPSADVRGEALHTVVTLAYSAQGADLRPALGALLSVFQTDPDERHRLLALRALETSGDDYVMSTLRSEADRETHPDVQWLLFAVLVDHYGVESLRHDATMVALARSINANSRR